MDTNSTNKGSLNSEIRQKNDLSQVIKEGRKAYDTLFKAIHSNKGIDFKNYLPELEKLSKYSSIGIIIDNYKSNNSLSSIKEVIKEQIEEIQTEVEILIPDKEEEEIITEPLVEEKNKIELNFTESTNETEEHEVNKNQIEEILRSFDTKFEATLPKKDDDVLKDDDIEKIKNHINGMFDNFESYKEEKENKKKDKIKQQEKIRNNPKKFLDKILSKEPVKRNNSDEDVNIVKNENIETDNITLLGVEHLFKVPESDLNFENDKNVVKQFIDEGEANIESIIEIEEVEIIIEQKIEKEEENILEEKFSFTDWLNFSSDEEKEEKKNEKKKEGSQLDIINKFIKNNPKITPLDKDSTPIEEENIPNSITVTLAKLYVEQGKNELAIKAFEVLSLKYPEKNAYFAEEIEKLKNK